MSQPILLATSFNPTPFQISLPSQIKDITNTIGTGYGLRPINNIITILLVGAVLLAFGFIIFGGFKWILSQGDPKEIETARNTIFYSAVGLGVAMLSILIINILGYFFNVPLLR